MIRSSQPAPSDRVRSTTCSLGPPLAFGRDPAGPPPSRSNPRPASRPRIWLFAKIQPARSLGPAQIHGLVPRTAAGFGKRSGHLPPDRIHGRPPATGAGFKLGSGQSGTAGSNPRSAPRHRSWPLAVIQPACPPSPRVRSTARPPPPELVFSCDPVIPLPPGQIHGLAPGTTAGFWQRSGQLAHPLPRVGSRPAPRHRSWLSAGILPAPSLCQIHCLAPGTTAGFWLRSGQPAPPISSRVGSTARPPTTGADFWQRSGQPALPAGSDPLAGPRHYR